MIFLIPLLFVIALIFGIDYLYFSNENKEVQKKEQKQDLNLDEKKQEYLKELFKPKQ
ncbi:TPA: hypothetical protein RTH03_000035 [Campylobacter jejuni]|nr:hypothetical protein [Campylobacter jejuni]HDZ5083835.1 hypothetical protein [Campylobacter jejuni]HDZ5084810.1 hypothetical protein [Campylobacter jejuni]HDZ5086521.1 hypothetical protein [Campylobacter jejuni]HDZ5089579.1 hypothetical protein [Campylobacter jejuni]